MSWFNRCINFGFLFLCCLTLSGCFRPLNGTFGKDSSSLTAELAKIDIESTSKSEVLNHYLVEDLRFEFTGGNPSKDIRYKLIISSSDGLTVPVIESSSGRAEIGSIVSSVNYTLKRLDTDTVLGSGTVSASATFDHMSQRFSSARARRDAEIRDAQVMAEDIRTRVAALLLQQK
jgi:LPS-assembly lipoprotein